MELLTAKEVAAKLRLKERTIWKKARAGEIPCIMVGRRMRFRDEDIAAMMVPTSPRVEAVLNLCEDSIEESELRSNLTETLNRSSVLKDRFLVKRNGQPIAAILPLEDLMLLETGEDMWLSEKASKVDRSDLVPFKPLREKAVVQVGWRREVYR